jgi:hypothetical protein
MNDLGVNAGGAECSGLWLYNPLALLRIPVDLFIPGCAQQSLSEVELSNMEAQLAIIVGIIVACKAKSLLPVYIAIVYIFLVQLLRELRRPRYTNALSQMTKIARKSSKKCRKSGACKCRCDERPLRAESRDGRWSEASRVYPQNPTLYDTDLAARSDAIGHMPQNVNPMARMSASVDLRSPMQTSAPMADPSLLARQWVPTRSDFGLPQFGSRGRGFLHF